LNTSVCKTKPLQCRKKYEKLNLLNYKRIDYSETLDVSKLGVLRNQEPGQIKGKGVFITAYCKVEVVSFTVRSSCPGETHTHTHTISIDYEACGIPEPVRTLQRREKPVAPARNQDRHCLASQSIPWALY
jgi:hypothetical protein